MFPWVNFAVQSSFSSAKVVTENKRVAVVGNGCSATQFMPIVIVYVKNTSNHAY